MKRTLIALPLLLLSTLAVSGCDKKNTTDGPFALTYGSLTSDATTEISYELLKAKMESNETMLVATHRPSGDHSCSCWATFTYQLGKVKESTNIQVYSVNAWDFEEKDNLGFEILKSDTPSFYIVSGGKVVRTYLGNDDQYENTFFQDYTYIKKELDKTVTYPTKMFYVNDTYLREHLFGETPDQKDVVCYVRNGCGDCTYVMPNVVVPYLSELSTVTNRVLVYDFQDAWYAANKKTATQEDKDAYQKIKDDFFLSNKYDADFGYSTGVVPTFQYYENGDLKDMSVYFNDSLANVEGKVQVADSYYTSDRVTKLNYLKNVDTKVLTGIEVPEADYTFYEQYSYYAWKNEAAAKYHTPILKAFLDTYVK